MVQHEFDVVHITSHAGAVEGQEGAMDPVHIYTFS